MDSLPVGFASELPVQQDGSTDRSPLNNAINMLAKMIWRKGGFRFWHRRIKSEYLMYVYYCSQDADRVPPSSATGPRDTQRMERFSCRSYLAFKPSLEGRTLEITLRHSYHAPYMDRKLSAAVLEFVRARRAFSTPAEIYRDLQAAQPSGFVSATPQQVYYQWQQANSSIWRRDPDPLVSAQGLLSEHPGYKSSMYVAANTGVSQSEGFDLDACYDTHEEFVEAVSAFLKQHDDHKYDLTAQPLKIKATLSSTFCIDNNVSIGACAVFMTATYIGELR
ncbi:hypothetical protein V1525DRAFT_389238 [Lipomyces kononenkoae]|uniref:Uncharacterized protein n=1 Tax=Lipomyces kononenkoae TaxID=34357 RepID=A0ACC3SZ64_LIPKO